MGGGKHNPWLVNAHLKIIGCNCFGFSTSCSNIVTNDTVFFCCCVLSKGFINNFEEANLLTTYQQLAHGPTNRAINRSHKAVASHPTKQTRIHAGRPINQSIVKPTGQSSKQIVHQTGWPTPSSLAGKHASLMKTNEFATLNAQTSMQVCSHVLR